LSNGVHFLPINGADGLIKFQLRNFVMYLESIFMQNELNTDHRPKAITDSNDM